MSRSTRHIFNIGGALTIILALVFSAWGANPAAAVQTSDGADFTAAFGRSAAGTALVQASVPAAAQVGDRVTFTLRSSGAQALAGFQFALQYDELGLDFESAQVAPEWKAAGYDVIMMGPVRRDGVVYFGAVACPVGDCASTNYQQPKLDLKAVPANAPLANFNFFVRSAGTHAFTVAESKLVNAQGVSLLAPQSAQAPNLKALDLTENGFVNDADASSLIGAWDELMERGECITPALAHYDLDGSGCLDAADAQMILAHWGESLSSTAAGPQAPSAVDRTFTVDDNGDAADAAVGDGACATAAAKCTLRAAIQEANAYPGRDTIAFNVLNPGGACPALVTIMPATNLTIDDPTGSGIVIEGYTQCGASPNNQPASGNAVIKVELKGSLTAGVDGLSIRSQNNIVRGLAIYDFDQQVSIRGARAHDNAIEGTFVGTNAAQNHVTDFTGLESNGVDMRVSAKDNTIGGVNLDKRVLVSGNDQDGVNIQGPDVSGNIVINTYIGLKQDGVSPLRNSSDGVDLAGGANQNHIGGLDPGERNVIGGNNGDGIEISHDSTNNNQILGNWIGLRATGTGTTPNQDRGVTFEDIVTQNTVRRNIIVGNYGYGVRFYTASDNDVLDNFIGVYPPGMTLTTPVPAPSSVSLASLINAGNGSNAAAGLGLSGVFALGGSQNNLIKGNIIANHPEYGVQISPEHGYLNQNGTCQTYFNTISENWIYNNGLRGIRLTTMAPTECSSQTFTGNQGLPAPVITLATTHQVTGTACANCLVEIFLADKTVINDPAGDNAGEGKIYLAHGAANGSGAFSINISGVTNGQIATATATSSTGNTSEFAQNVIITIDANDIGDNQVWLPLIIR